MDEILDSIRRIIEGGDERGSPFIHEQARQVTDVGMPGADANLDLEARVFSEGRAISEETSEREASHSSWPEGPGEPANDRTAMVAQLKRETNANTPHSVGDKLGPSAEARKSGEGSAPSAGIGSTGTADTGSSADVGPVETFAVGIDGDGAAEVSPAIEQARQSAQSLAARTERLIAVVAGLSTNPEVADNTDIGEENDPSLLLPPAVAASLIASTEMPGPPDDKGKEDTALQDSLRSLRQDALDAAVPVPVVARAAEAVALDAFGEFDEDEFANELLDRTAMLDVAASSLDGGSADVAPFLSDKKTREGDRQGSVNHAAQDGVCAPAATFRGDESLHPRMDAAIHQLISDEASRRVSASFTDLAFAIRDEQMQSIDETVRTMLRPMLQDWLDDNLPHMVERLVREEIERVARGGRR